MAKAKRVSLSKAARAAGEAKRREALRPENLIALLRRVPQSTGALCKLHGASEREVMDAIGEAQGRGYLLYQYGDKWSMEKAPPMQAGNLPVYKSRRDGTYVFGFSSDQHLGSKYERLDVLNDLYDKFEAAGVDRVFNCGNWIDGEHPKYNRYDLQPEAHGMQAQCEYLVRHYPQRKGIVTYSVAGDDHEGWYSQREGVDIGAFAAGLMKESGRTDWVNLGYMEAYVDMQHARTKEACKLHMMHPGGGSAYADSYKPQKIVEAYQGGEKPAVLLVGHYHKLGLYPIRNVWVIQTGCTKDYDRFGKKNILAVAVGGGICELTQDPNTGAIVSCKVEMFAYFNRGYYTNNRFSMSGPVTLPDRGVSLGKS